MMLQNKVSDCLAEDGSHQRNSFDYGLRCGYGIELPCKYQGKLVVYAKGGKVRVVFPCSYVLLDFDIEMKSSESVEPLTELDALLEG